MRRLEHPVGSSLASVAFASALHAQISDKASLQANELLARMTVLETIGLMNQLLLFPGPPPDKEKGSYEDRVGRGELGSFLIAIDPKPINELQKIAMTE